MTQEDIGGELSIFFKTLARVFVPSQYPELSKRHLVTSFKFFVSSLAVIFFIVMALSIPKLMTLTGSIEHQLSQFNSIDFDMNGPVSMPSVNPSFVFETSNQYENSSTVHINTNRIRLNNYFVSFSNTQELSEFLFLIFLMILPGLIIFSYFYYLVKYLVIILILSLLAKGITHFSKYYCSFQHLFVAGIYSIPLLIIVDSVNLLFMYNLYYVQYLLYFIFYLLVCFKISKHKAF